jgi:hypothetical protein
MSLNPDESILAATDRMGNIIFWTLEL